MGTFDTVWIEKNNKKTEIQHLELEQTPMFLFIYHDKSRFGVCMAKNQLSAIDILSRGLHYDITEKTPRGKLSAKFTGFLLPPGEYMEHMIISDTKQNQFRENISKTKRKLKLKLYWFWNHTILLTVLKLFHFEPQHEDFG